MHKRPCVILVADSNWPPPFVAFFSVKAGI